MKTSQIDSSKYTAHLHPGKFEGETSGATEYFYEQFLHGDGETIYSETDENVDEFSTTAEIFRLTSEEVEAFGLPSRRHYFLLREDSQGFCYGSVHATRADAEAKFRAWLGL